MEEQRKTVRYKPKEGVKATFKFTVGGKELSAKASRLWDISKQGCSFELEPVEDLEKGQVGTLELQTGFEKDEISGVEVKRMWDDGLAVVFKNADTVEKYFGKGQNVVQSTEVGEEETILATFRSTIKLSRSAHSWWKQIEVHDKRTTDQREHAFFEEYKNELESVFVQSTETVVKGFFREYGIMEENFPRIRIDKSYSGSWIIVVWVVVGVYGAADAISKIPKILDGLKELKRRLEKDLLGKIHKIVRKWMKSSGSKKKLPAPSAKLVKGVIDIDIGPLLELEKRKTAEEKAKLEFARLDYELVNGEVASIDSNLKKNFWLTLGLVATLSATVLTEPNILGLYAGRQLLPFLVIIFIVFLNVSVFYAIQGMRKINKRLGYLGALSEYLSKGLVPQYFSGWTKAKVVLARCRLYMSAKAEEKEANEAGEKERAIKAREVARPIEKCKVPKRKASKSNSQVSILRRIRGQISKFPILNELFKQKHMPACLYESKKNAEAINARIELLPAFLDSFTSMSMYLYSFVYGITIVALLFGIKTAVVEYITDFEVKTYLNAIGVGFVVASIFVLLSIRSKLASKRSKVSRLTARETKMEKLFRYYRYNSIIVVCMLWIGLIYAYAYGAVVSAFWIAMVVYILGGIIGTMTVCLAYSCYDKVNSLRRGRYSIERWRHIWKLCFKHCPLMDSEI